MYRRKKDSKKAIQNLLDFYAQIGNSQKEQERKASSEVYQDIVTQGDKAPEKKVR